MACPIPVLPSTARRWRRAGGALAVPLIGCALPQLPGEPSELVEGVVIYEHANFAGRSALVTNDLKDLKDSGSCDHDGLNDCLTSIRLVRR